MMKMLQILCVVLLGVLIGLPFLQVIMRDVFGSAIVGLEELTRFMLICTVFVAYPLVVNRDENIVMGELRGALPDKLRRGLDLLVSLFSVAACGLVAVVTAMSISDNMNNATPTLGIPFWVFLGACFVGFAGACLIHIIHLRRASKNDTVTL